MDVEQAKVAATEGAAKAKDAALAGFAAAQEMGFFSHFSEYNAQLISPWQGLMNNDAIANAGDYKAKAMVLFDMIKAEVIAVLTLSPADPLAGFRLYNVLGFWFGVFESLIMAFLGHGFISLAWNAAVGYAIAYTLYWTMTCTKVKKLMFYAMVFIALYIAFNIYMGLKTLIFVVPAAFYFTKALCDVLMIVCGYKLYLEVAGDSLFTGLL
jgi:hypothetical protein